MTITHPFKLLLTCVITSLLTACGGSSSDTPEPLLPIIETIVVDYQNVINDIVSEDIPGIVLMVEKPQTRFQGSAGVSNLQLQRAMQVTDTIPTANIGKNMIALLVAQLADEGLLTLYNILDTWLSDTILSRFSNSHQMTFRQLLNHTSGIFNYADVDDGEAYTELLLAEPEVLKTDIDFLELIFDHFICFLAGEGYEYLNTGYSLAALIMDDVLGVHHSVAMRNRFFDPLGMTATFYKGRVNLIQSEK
jgi:D-alanyl-D-alanine carboxypeptidase